MGIVTKQSKLVLSLVRISDIIFGGKRKITHRFGRFRSATQTIAMRTWEWIMCWLLLKHKSCAHKHLQTGTRKAKATGAHSVNVSAQPMCAGAANNRKSHRNKSVLYRINLLLFAGSFLIFIENQQTRKKKAWALDETCSKHTMVVDR